MAHDRATMALRAGTAHVVVILRDFGGPPAAAIGPR
jgi:hypothetical protein